MRTKRPAEKGNVLICALCTILVISLIGANVLQNCTTRFNVSSSQVRSWKEALMAAEAGGDLAYAEVRKTVLDPLKAFPIQDSLGNPSWTNDGVIHLSPDTTFGANSLKTKTVVDLFYHDPITGNAWYRMRSKGTAPVNGVSRVGMDDRMGAGVHGDSLLRKIDFRTDHFIATYGERGDGTGPSPTITPVPYPQITRRIEQISAPVTPFEAAIKCTGSFYGLGSAAQVDSYNSKNGPYRFVANSPADPQYKDSRSGSVMIGTPVADVNGRLYGNISTNGGTIRPSPYISGTVDNNVPFTCPPFKMPSDMPAPQPSPTKVDGTSGPVSLTPPVAGTPTVPTFYLFSQLSGQLTVYPVGSAETYVAIRVTNDVLAKITVKSKVHLKVFFDGNMDVKGRDMDNESNLAANLQYYAISPANPATTQFIHIAPPGNFAATFYAPSADVVLNGNPDLIGAVVCKTFYGNGNTSWHYDRSLDNEGDAVDYRIVSYVEDIR